MIKDIDAAARMTTDILRRCHTENGLLFIDREHGETRAFHAGEVELFEQALELERFNVCLKANYERSQSALEQAKAECEACYIVITGLQEHMALMEAVVEAAKAAAYIEGDIALALDALDAVREEK